MKLIDILVEELPKRGGWPDTAEWCVYHNIDEEVSFGYREFPLLSGDTWTTTDNNSHWLSKGEFVYLIPSDFDSAIITRAQYESALAAKNAPAWNGEGLPPVGCVCEALMPQKPGEPWAWKSVKVVESGIQGAEKECLVYDIKSTIPAWVDEFRPLRTEADRKREAASKEMARHANNDYESGFAAGLRNCLSIYDAISAGKIPGVKLEG